MKSFSSLIPGLVAGLLLTASLSAQELLIHYNFDEASSGSSPAAIDHGTAEPRVDGRFFNGATRTSNTPGGASIGALDVTQGGHILANKGHPAVPSLDGKLDNLYQTTITLWVNLQAEPQNHDRIFSTGIGGVGLQIIEPQEVDGVEPDPMSASNFSLALDTYDGSIPSYSNFDADNKWLFVAVTFDGDRFDEEKVKFYAGGEETETALRRALGTLAWDVTRTLPDHLMIGRHSSAANREIEGYVDDFRIYRSVMTLEQIEAVRQENLIVTEPPAEYALLLHYNFDEAASGDEPTLDRGEIEPLIDGRFLGGATRTANTPGGASTGALDATAPEAWVIANPNDLDGKLDSLTAFTTTLWVNLQAPPRHLDRIFRAGGSTGFGYRIVEPASGTLSASNFSVAVDVGGGAALTDISIDADNKWVFIAATFDATKVGEQVQLIVGGESAAAALKAVVPSANISDTGVLTELLALGRHPTATTRVMNGYLDDFRIYRGALSLAEIEAIRLENLGDSAPASGFEDWLAQQFDPEELQDPSISGPDADPEGNGIPNLIEYALAGNRDSASRDLLPVAGVDPATGFLTLTFVRPTDATSVEFIVESSADLEQWTANAELIDSVPVANGTRETYRAPSGDSGRIFLRLHVQQQN